MKMLRVGRSVSLIAVVMLVAGAAAAQMNVPLAAKYANVRGPFIRFPAVGNTPCPSIQIGANIGQLTVPLTMTPPMPATTNFGLFMNPHVANPLGCVGGTAMAVPVTPAATPAGPPGANPPAAFEVRPNLFNIALPGTPVQADPLVPGILSVKTSLSIMGPPNNPLEPLPTGTPPVTTGARANWRHFRPSAWTTQSGRAGPDFTWCWGGPNKAGGGAFPYCTNVNQGTTELITKYTAGPNRFGGTMSIVLSTAFGQLAITGGLPPGFVLLQPLNTGSVSQPEGRGYAVFDEGPVGTGVIWTMFTLTPTSGFVGMVSGNAIPQSPATNYARGFPFTTGTVLVRETGTQQGNPDIVTLTGRGSDGRQPDGLAGNIQLVSGGMTRTLLANGTNLTPNLGIMRLTFLPEPGSTLLLASGVLALFGLHAWRSRRRG